MDSVTGRVSGEEPGVTQRRDPWGVVFLLLFIGVLNYLDRLLPGVLAEPIRQELGLTDTALGIINGFGFLIVYALSGIPISRLADRGHHAAVIAASLGLWSAMTALGSVTRTGWQFGFTRLGVALGEAGSTPASHAFVSRAFSPERRARALSILSLGGAGGTMMGLMVGGYVGSVLGWRHTFLLMGAVGLLLAPIAWFAMRRHGGAAEVVAAAQGKHTGRWTDLFRTRSGTLIVIAASLIATGAYATIAFNAAFLMRGHGLSIAQAGVQLGLAAGFAGMAALLITGWVADWLARTDVRWTLGVLAGTMLLAVPILLVAYTSDSAVVAVLGLGLGSACMNSYIALTVVALYRLVPPDVRARTSATLLFSTAVFGGMGPLLVGIVSDALAPTQGKDALGHAMLLVPALSVAGAVLYLLAARSYRADMARVAATFP